MTYHVGDTIELSAAAKDLDGNAVTDASGAAVVSVLEIGGAAKPVTDAAMTYNPSDSAWQYVWQTAGLPVVGGGYRVVVRMVVGDKVSVETRNVVVYPVDPDTL